MPREIEFRGYDLDLKKWFYGGYHKHIKRQIAPFGDELKEEDIQHMIIIDGFADWNLPKPIQVVTNIDKNSVGQYTGLKDKNGKKIFEGDIVKRITIFKSKILESIDCVEFEKGCFISKNTSLKKHLFLCEKYELEVIGNIYENKELLENE